MGTTIDRADDRALQWVAGTPHGVLRPVLVGTARAADVLLPWVAVSLGLLADGRDANRSKVVRGWAGMAAAAAVEDTVVKPLTRRGRPDADRLPSGQRRHTSPSTSAFPSGHVGAAAAFALATGRDAPRLQRSLAGLALLVAYARVYTGRHYLSDAAVGLVIGTGVGAFARLVPARRAAQLLPGRAADDGPATDDPDEPETAAAADATT